MFLTLLKLYAITATCREEEEGKPIEINKDRKILTKAQSFDERNLEKTSVTTSG